MLDVGSAWVAAFGVERVPAAEFWSRAAEVLHLGGTRAADLVARPANRRRFACRVSWFDRDWVALPDLLRAFPPGLPLEDRFSALSLSRTRADAAAERRVLMSPEAWSGVGGDEAPVGNVPWSDPARMAGRQDAVGEIIVLLGSEGNCEREAAGQGDQQRGRPAHAVGDRCRLRSNFDMLARLRERLNHALAAGVATGRLDPRRDASRSTSPSLMRISSCRPTDSFASTADTKFTPDEERALHAVDKSLAGLLRHLQSGIDSSARQTAPRTPEARASNLTVPECSVSADRLRVVQITGQPGVGKSSLALAIANSLLIGGKGAWDTAYYADLRETAHYGAAQIQLATAIGFPPCSYSPHALHSAAWRLRPLSFGVILDNADIIPEEDLGALIFDLVSRCVGAQIVVTRRQEAAVQGLRGHSLCLRPLGATTCAHMLAQVLPGEPQRIEEISPACGGLPGALSILAPAVVSLGPEEVLRAIRSQGGAGQPDAGLTPRARFFTDRCVQVAMQGLERDARRALLALSFIPGRFSMSLAVAVLSAAMDWRQRGEGASECTSSRLLDARGCQLDEMSIRLGCGEPEATGEGETCGNGGPRVGADARETGAPTAEIEGVAERDATQGKGRAEKEYKGRASKMLCRLVFLRLLDWCSVDLRLSVPDAVRHHVRAGGCGGEDMRSLVRHHVRAGGCGGEDMRSLATRARRELARHLRACLEGVLALARDGLWCTASQRVAAQMGAVGGLFLEASRCSWGQQAALLELLWKNGALLGAWIHPSLPARFLRACRDCPSASAIQRARAAMLKSEWERAPTSVDVPGSMRELDPWDQAHALALQARLRLANSPPDWLSAKRDCERAIWTLDQGPAKCEATCARLQSLLEDALRAQPSAGANVMRLECLKSRMGRLRSAGWERTPLALDAMLGMCEAMLEGPWKMGAASLGGWALGLAEGLFGEIHPETARALRCRGHSALARRQFDEARRLLARATEVLESCGMSGSVESARTTALVGRLEWEARNLGEAKVALSAAIRMLSGGASLGVEHGLVLADCGGLLGAALQEMFQHRAAERVLRWALDVAERSVGKGHMCTGVVKCRLASVLAQCERHVEAEALFAGAVEIYRGADKCDLQMAEAMEGLAAARSSQGGLDDAEVVLMKACAIRRDALGDGHGLVAAALLQVAELHLRKGKLEAARRGYEGCLGHGSRGDELACRAHVGLGCVLWRLGSKGEARRHMKAAIMGLEAAHGLADSRVAQCLFDIGKFFAGEGDAERAAKFLSRAVQIVDAGGGLGTLLEADLLLEYGALCADAGRCGEACARLRQCVDAQRRLWDCPHPRLGRALMKWAAVLQALGQEEEVRDKLGIAVGVLERALGPDHAETARAREMLGWALHRAGDPRDEGCFQRALAARELRSDGDRRSEARLLGGLGHALSRRGAGREAKGALSEAVGIWEREGSLSREDVASLRRARIALGRALTALGELDEALEPCQKALEMFSSSDVQEGGDVGEAKAALAGVLAARGDRQEAERLFREALELFQASDGPEGERVADALVDLAGLAAADESAGRGREAESMYWRALHCYESLQGEEGPKVAVALRGILGVLGAGARQGRLEAAEKMDQLMRRFGGAEGSLAWLQENE
eukprot:evm.model.scf_71.9 EVM.evm.TU.scf_71.9   scf_71:123761-129782(+)